MKKIAFTIVLNGMKFLPEQMERIPDMFDKWYIIEGPVKPINCTSWCKEIPPQYINDVNMSSDGTYEYLNEINNPKIEVVRPPKTNNIHRHWNGKVEMCNSFMDNVENSILMQVDMDEFWSNKVLADMFNWCEQYNGPKTLRFKCNFFVGEDLITAGEHCYGDMPYEWDRLWIINEKTNWKSHEPPSLNRLALSYDKEFTTDKNWGFRHYAYKYEEQVKFKEDYYGYVGAVDGWKRLQNETKFPVYLRDYFPWVNDHTQVVKI